METHNTCDDNIEYEDDEEDEDENNYENEHQDDVQCYEEEVDISNKKLNAENEEDDPNDYVDPADDYSEVNTQECQRDGSDSMQKSSQQSDTELYPVVTNAPVFVQQSHKSTISRAHELTNLRTEMQTNYDTKKRKREHSDKIIVDKSYELATLETRIKALKTDLSDKKAENVTLKREEESARKVLDETIKTDAIVNALIEKHVYSLKQYRLTAEK